MTPALAWAAAPFLAPPPLGPVLPFSPADFHNHGLRGYQLDLLFRVVEAIRAGHRRILVQCPTGGGKTKLATALLASATWAQFIVHRKELIEQTSRAFWNARIPHSFVAADMPYDEDAAVLLCGIATLAERLGVVLPPEIIIVDEAHHALATTWAAALEAHPDALVIGLTATPQRLDGRGLDQFFTTLILGPEVRWLINQQFLSDYDYYGPPPGGEDDTALIGDAVEHYLRLAPGQPGIVFAPNREHSRSLVDAFQANGVRALHVDGSMTKKERERADAMFKARDVDLLSNVALFGEGYDVPGIVYCGIVRRTKSLAWFRQMVGRALRPVYAGGYDLESIEGRREAIVWSGKPRAIICDHGNNWFLHGMPDDEIAWSLAGRSKGGASGCNDDATPIHQCLGCYMITPSAVKVCPGCGAEFPTQTRNIRFKEGTLTKIEREQIRAQQAEEKAKAAMLRKAEEQACRSEAALIDLARRRGYNNPVGWAKGRLRARAGGRGRR